MRHARGVGRAKRKNSPEEASDSLRARLSQWFGIPGEAAEGYIAHAGHVGVAGNRPYEWHARGLASAAALDYRDRLCGGGNATSGAGWNRGAVGPEGPHRAPAADRAGAENPAGGEGHLKWRVVK